MNKQQLAARIWASANKMRSKIEASEYKDYILGFIFYKYLSDKEEQFMLNEGGMTQNELPHVQEQDEEIVQYCQTNIGYFIAYDNLFSTWLSKGADFSVQDVTVALSAFERLINEDYKKLFEGIFSSLSVGLSKLGSTAAQQSKAILDLLALIKDIPTDGRQGYDVLGFIYEYLIGQFAANAGKKAGEFYTPHEVSVLMSEIVASHLRDRKSISIYDPTSGSGSLLLNIGKAISKHANKDNVHYYAQELKSATYNLTRMNLVMRGIKPGNIEVRNADTLEEDWPKDERTGAPTLYLDAVVSNPPYSQPWNPANKELDPRYQYGVAPKGKADYAFLLHDLYHLKPEGIMTIVLPHGVLFRGDPAKEEAEGVIRKNLIENNHIDAIIGLPADIFFGTPISTIIMVLRQKRDRDDVLFIDARKGFIKSGKKNKLRASDIRRIVDTFVTRENIDKYSCRVSREKIRENGYNLNIPRYVDSSDAAETWDLYATMYGAIPNREIDALPYWRHLPTLRETLFDAISDTHSVPTWNDEGPEGDIEADESFSRLRREYGETMDGLPDYLQKELLSSVATVDTNREEEVISAELFERLGKHPIFNPYDVYQLLDDSWQIISEDLEVLQTEGWEQVRKIEPNMVLKKKKDKATGVETEYEIQDGWKGRIMPFELVQKTFLGKELERIAEVEARTAECASEIETMISELSDENREKYIEEDKLLTKELAADVKAMQKDPELRDKELMALQAQLEKQKEQNRLLKRLREDLIDSTCHRIENLTDKEAYGLLFDKWIRPLCDKVFSMPNELQTAVEKDVLALKKRYADTLLSVDTQIADAEKELAAMLDELTGDDADMQAIQEMSKLTGSLNVIKKLFPQPGERVPAIRFKGFTGKWDENLLSKYLTVSTERNENNKYSAIDIQSVSGEYGVVNQIEFQGRSFAGASLLNYRVIHHGEIAYTKSPLKLNPYGIIKANKGNTGIVSALYGIYKIENADANFIQYYFDLNQRINNYLRPLVNKGAKNTLLITDEDALTGQVVFPKVDEQKKIAEFIDSITKLILLNEKRLILLKHTKQALLEQMFVNE